MILQTISGGIKVLHSAVTAEWSIFSSALEAAPTPDVFPLPLDDDEYDRWLALVMLMESRVAYEPEYYLGERIILYQEDYRRIVALMDPCDEYLLYCIPADGTREEYEAIGRVVASLFKHDAPKCVVIDDTIGRSCMELIKSPVQTSNPSALIALGITHCSIVENGVIERDSDRGMPRLDYSRVNWKRFIDHRVQHIPFSNSEMIEMLAHRQGYTKENYGAYRDLNDKRYIDGGGWKNLYGAKYCYCRTSEVYVAACLYAIRALESLTTVEDVYHFKQVMGMVGYRCGSVLEAIGSTNRFCIRENERLVEVVGEEGDRVGRQLIVALFEKERDIMLAGL